MLRFRYNVTDSVTENWAARQGGLLVDGVLASCNVAAGGASESAFAAALAPVRAAYAQVPSKQCLLFCRSSHCLLIIV